jgi:hypothetical protein
MLAFVRPFHTQTIALPLLRWNIAIHPTILLNPMPMQVYLNLKFASERQCTEHVFGDHRPCFKLFLMSHSLHLFDRGVKVQKQCLLSFFMLN